MSSHDYVLNNDTGANFRADLNLALLANQSQNSGSSEPSTTYAYQWWADTSGTPTLKQRNAANNAWISILTLSTGAPAVTELSADASPQLGANLDVLGYGLTSSTSIMQPTLTSTGKALILGF